MPKRALARSPFPFAATPPDVDFFELAYQQTQPSLLAYFRAKLGCSEVAADLAQETWLRLTRIARPETIANPRAYIFRVAENLVIDQLRKRLSRPAPDHDIPEDARVCPAPRPHAQVQAWQQFRLLEQAIEELPPKCCDAFLLHCIEGLTYSRIAERQGVSVKTVEKHLLKALNHCREHLTDADI
ncbi:MAG: RNA polymerase sigma factor [Methylococcales bacterium]